MRKPHTIRRVTVFLASLLLATSVGAVALPSAAHARCRGEGELVSSTLVVNGVTHVRETPVSGTCNGNGTYRASYTSARAGWSAWLILRLPGSPWRETPFLAEVGQPVGYEFSLDPDQNTFLMVLCATNFQTVYCGFGDQFVRTTYPNTSTAVYGQSWGF